MKKILLLAMFMVTFTQLCFAQESEAYKRVRANALAYEKSKEFKPPQVFPRPYHLTPMIAPDGTFYSPRYLDYDRRAAELYKVSGASIYSYGLRSMYNRNQLERQLDLERYNWELRKHYYLHNTTPWLRSN